MDNNIPNPNYIKNTEKLKFTIPLGKATKVGVYVMMNSEFTNYFLPKAIENIIECIEYTHKNTGLCISQVNFVVSAKDKDRYFALKSANISTLSTKDTTFKVLYKEETTISEIFNTVKNSIVDLDYVAFYGANTLWVKNHIQKSIDAMLLEKRDWSVSFTELKSDITSKKSEILNYKEPNLVNHLVDDILIGEIVVKAEKLKLVEFGRGKVTEGTAEYFYPGYALKTALKEYSICNKTTVRHHMTFLNEEQLEYVAEDYKFDVSTIPDDDKTKLIFTVIVNLTNIQNQAKMLDVLNSIGAQQFPLENTEFLLITNYNSMSLYISQPEIQQKFPNHKIIFVANNLQDEYGGLKSVVYATGLQNARGEIITYLDASEGFLYSSAYLSELYLLYREGGDDVKWALSNYFNVVNYIPKHSNIKVLNRNQAYFSLFSHKKDLPIQYPTIKAIDKYFGNTDLSLINIINYYNNQNIKGTINPKATVHKLN